MDPTTPYYVIIPAYKPDEGLIELTRQVCDRGWQLIVINDGSGPAYDNVFAQLDPRATILVHEVNQGKGAGIKTGLAHVDAVLNGTETIVGIMDADGQHLPDDMARVLAAAAENIGDEHTPAKLALGVRVIDGQMPLRSRFGNAMTRWIFHLVSGTKVSDTQTGLRAFTTAMIPMMLDIDGDRYEYEINVLSMVARRHYGFCEVPIQTIYRDRENSTSHFRVIRDSFRIYRSLLKYVLSSLLSFVLDFGLFWLFSELFLAAGQVALALPMANVLARLISSTFNYFINCNLVFKNKPTVKNAAEYGLLCVFNLGASIGLQYLWAWLPAGFPLPVCKLLAEICMFVISYFIQKKIIFKRRSKRRQSK